MCPRGTRLVLILQQCLLMMHLNAAPRPRLGEELIWRIRFPQSIGTPGPTQVRRLLRSLEEGLASSWDCRCISCLLRCTVDMSVAVRHSGLFSSGIRRKPLKLLSVFVRVVFLLPHLLPHLNRSGLSVVYELVALAILKLPRGPDHRVG